MEFCPEDALAKRAAWQIPAAVSLRPPVAQMPNGCPERATAHRSWQSSHFVRRAMTTSRNRRQSLLRLSRHAGHRQGSHNASTMKKTTLMRAEEGRFDDKGRWQMERVWNGDQ